MRLTLRDDLILVSITVVHQDREVEVPYGEYDIGEM